MSVCVYLLSTAYWGTTKPFPFVFLFSFSSTVAMPAFGQSFSVEGFSKYTLRAIFSSSCIVFGVLGGEAWDGFANNIPLCQRNIIFQSQYDER